MKMITKLERTLHKKQGANTELLQTMRVTLINESTTTTEAPP